MVSWLKLRQALVLALPVAVLAIALCSRHEEIVLTNRDAAQILSALDNMIPAERRVFNREFAIERLCAKTADPAACRFTLH